MMTIGEKVWNRLRAEGGFVWTVADGRQFVHFNRGCHPSRELIDILKRHREDLKAFVDRMHADDERRWAKATTPTASGSSRRPDRLASNGRGGRTCECNGVERLPISAETAAGGLAGRPAVKTGAISAVAAVAVAFLAACGEISCGATLPSGGLVGLVANGFNVLCLGSGARTCPAGMDGNRTEA